MIISHKYKFIFVKTRKTAGTSIEMFLADKCGKEDVLTPFGNFVKGKYYRTDKDVLRSLDSDRGEGGVERFRNYRKQKFSVHMHAHEIK